MNRTRIARISLTLTLISFAPSAPPSLWGQADEWNKHIAAGQKAYLNGMQEKYRHVWDTSFYVGDTPRSLADFKKAEGEILAALALAQAFPPGDLRMANTLSGLASVYLEEGRFAEAEERQQQSVATAEASVGPDDPGLAKSLANLAMLYDYDSQCDQAAPVWNRSLAILKKAGKVDLDWLSKVEFRVDTSGTYRGCEKLSYQYLLEVRELSGASGKELAKEVSRLAGYQRGPDAEQAYLRLLTIERSIYGAEFPGGAIGQLATVYNEEGKYSAEVQLLEPALEATPQTNLPSDAKQQKSGDRSGRLPLSRKLAQAYIGVGNYPKAEELYKRVVSMDEARTDRNRDLINMDLSDDLVGLSQVYRLEHRFDEALDTVKRSEMADDEIANSRWWKEKAKTGEPLVWLWLSQVERAEIDREKGDAAAAEHLFQQAVEIKDRAAADFLGPGDPRFAHVLDNYATLLRDEGKSAAAEPIYQRALNTWAKSKYPDHADVAGTLTDYAALLRKLNRPSEAEPLEARASAILAKAGGMTHPAR